MPKRKSNKKAYYVTYAITREYLYRIKAESLQAAQDTAFEDGDDHVVDLADIAAGVA